MASGPLAELLAEVERLRFENGQMRRQLVNVEAVGSSLVNNGSGNTSKDRAERDCGVRVLQALRLP